MKKYLQLISIGLIILILLSGCNLIEKDTTEGKVIDGKHVMAIVNDDYILKSDFDLQLEQIKSALELSGHDFSTSEGQKNFQEVKKKVLDSMINDDLALQNAKKLNVTLKEGEMQEAIEQIETYHGGKEALDKYLKEQGMSRDKFEALVQQQLIINQLREKLTGDVKVTDEEVKKYYDDNKEMFQLTSPEIRASHILVETKEEAEEILAKIKAGEDFAELAKKYSIDGSKDNGGDLGFFGRGKMVPEFEKAAFELKLGQVSEIVKSEYGYHIIKVTGERSSLTFEDVKNYIKTNLESARKEEEFDKNS